MGQAANEACKPGFSIVQRDDGFRSAVLDRKLVEHMRARVSAHTKECVMATFGISANTWVKIKRGEPIRRSTVEQLMKRLERSIGDGGGPSFDLDQVSRQRLGLEVRRRRGGFTDRRGRAISLGPRKRGRALRSKNFGVSY